jgi:hypothetical protein
VASTIDTLGEMPLDGNRERGRSAEGTERMNIENAQGPLSLVLDAGLSLLAIARVAGPVASRVAEVSVRWHLEGYA